MMPTERVLESAEIAAVYFRALVNRGVPAQHAVSLTSSFCCALVIAGAQQQEPQEPWETP